MAYHLEAEEILVSPEIDQTNRAEIFARGPNFVYAKEFILKVHGEAVWKQVMERLPPLDANIWYGSLFTLGTYPFSSFKKTVILDRLLKAVQL